MNVSPAGRSLIERFEGCVLHAYQDVVGVWTIGYGHTDGVQPGQVISLDIADRMLSDDLNRVYGPGVEAAIADAPTTQPQFDAMVSLAYNIGVGAFRNSTVCRMHKAGNHTAAAEGFALWNKAGGNILPALTRRRAAEAQLYLSSAVPSAVTPRDTIKRIQEALGVVNDGAFGPISRAAFNAVLQAAGQQGI